MFPLFSFNLFKSPFANKGCLTSSYFCAAVHFFFSHKPPLICTYSSSFPPTSWSLTPFTSKNMDLPFHQSHCTAPAFLFTPSFYNTYPYWPSSSPIHNPLNLNQTRSSWSQQPKRQLSKNTRKRMSLSLRVVASAPPCSSPQLQQQWRPCEALKTSGMKHIPVYEPLWYKTAQVIQLYPARVICVWLRDLDDQMYGRLKAGAWYCSISALRFPSQILSLICGGAGFFLRIPLAGNSQMWNM